MLPNLPLETSHAIEFQKGVASLISVINLDLKQLAESIPHTNS